MIRMIAVRDPSGSTATSGGSGRVCRMTPKRSPTSRLETWRSGPMSPCLRARVRTRSIVFIHGGALIMGGREWIDPAPTGRLPGRWLRGRSRSTIGWLRRPGSTAIVSDLDDAVAWVRGDGAERFDLDPASSRASSATPRAATSRCSRASAPSRARRRSSPSTGMATSSAPWYTRPDPFYLGKPLVAEADAWAGVRGAPVSNAAGPRQRRAVTGSISTAGNRVCGRRTSGATIPRATPDAFAPYCPVRLVTAAYPPTLLLHGDHDTDVPYAAVRPDGGGAPGGRRPA